MDIIELLDTHLLDDSTKLKEIDHWARVLNWQNGWHYDLDIVWVLQQLERMHLPEGATILDAGAGFGLTQFILASRGYNIVSLDFTNRLKPRFAEGIFNVDVMNRELGAFHHEYMEWMTYGMKEKEVAPSSLLRTSFQLIRFLKLFGEPGKAMFLLKQRALQCLNPFYLCEKQRDHSKFGTITFLRGTFNAIPLPEQSVDALVSVSAFEHNTYEEMPGSVLEFFRVLKNGAPMLVTTSAARDKDWYFEPAKAWNFTAATLSKWFDIHKNIAFDYDRMIERIRNSHIMRSRIADFYKYNGDNGLPYADLEDARYIPVGIVKSKLSSRDKRVE